MRFLRTTGIHLRQRARAFVFVDRATQRRVAYVVADIGMFFANVTDAVLARLDPGRYDGSNVVLTATHTHAGVAGYSGYRLYNMTTDGFRPHTFAAIVDGVVAAIEQADRDLAPARLLLGRGELHDASVNRSPTAFGRNPATDRAAFPDAVDPRTILLRIERGGRLVGAVNWFATHGTSLSNRNTLISGDNKGYAAYHWERLVARVDYRERPELVTAFAQTNAGDMSPNVPDATCGPTSDQYENARLIGLRQYDAAAGLATGPAVELEPAVQTRRTDVRLPLLDVDGRWTPDGRPHRTGRAVLGAAFAAGTKEGPGARAFSEGVDGNHLLRAACGVAWRFRPAVADAQRPKAMLLPVGALGWTAEVLPVQLVRLGPLVLLALAHEVTIVAGLRLRRAVAAALDVDVDDVVVQGYANDYAGYLTTPEEYDAQRYEGGHTMFGRWQLPAYLQEVTRLAGQLRAGEPEPPAQRRAPGRQPRPARSRPRRAAVPAPVDAAASYPPGAEVSATFRVADPRGRVAANYLLVERRTDDGWQPVADDGDWSTTVTWAGGRDGWAATLTWRVPEDAAGSFRLRYLDGSGAVSREFDVAPPAATSAPATGR